MKRLRVIIDEKQNDHPVKNFSYKNMDKYKHT